MFLLLVCFNITDRTKKAYGVHFHLDKEFVFYLATILVAIHESNCISKGMYHPFINDRFVSVDGEWE